MLHLLLQAGLDRYALEVNQVVEVLPLVHLHPLPQAPRGVIGAFHFHGTPVSVIDLSLSLTGHPTPSRTNRPIHARPDCIRRSPNPHRTAHDRLHLRPVDHDGLVVLKA